MTSPAVDAILDTRPVRVRIAPSPTGEPHVGTAYIALFNLAFARRHGGTFVLRIEDTDRKRSTPQSEQAILRCLRWCGLTWDEGPDIGGPFGPYRQSERAATYQAHARTLIENGSAYRCFCTADRLDTVRAAQKAAGEDWRYDGACRHLPASEAAARAAAGEPHVVRLAVPRGGETVVADLLRGAVAYDNSRIDDQVLLKSDGLPTYHLANVVDDHLMQITHVIRAEEWLTSTPKHLLLYDAFGWQAPVFCHMPLLRNADRSKISKRKNPTSLEYYQRAGVLPEALCNFLATLGWSMPNEQDVFDRDAFFAAIELQRVTTSGPVFDLERLHHLNGVWLRRLGPEALATRTAAFLSDEQRDIAIAGLVAERVTTLADWLHHARPFYGSDVELDSQARQLWVGASSRKKNAVRLGPAASRAFFEDVIARLEATSLWEPAPIEAALREAAAASGAATGDAFMAIRVAVVGRVAAPGLFETMATLGRALTLGRLRRAAQWVGDPAAAEELIARLQGEIDALRAARDAAAAASAAIPGGVQ